jgi:uncharacterized repeat protein (TIGR01451 family)
MEFGRALGLAAFLFGTVATLPAYAAFHLVQIDEVMAGANGNPAIQFIELIMLADEENCQQSGETDPNGPFGCVDGSGFPDFSAARLFFFDANGSQIGEPEGVPFPSNAPVGTAGRSILLGTQAFDDLPLPTPDPDFIIPALVVPNSGRICYRTCCFGFDPFVNQCLAYGGFSGDNESFGSPAVALPIAGITTLRRISNSLNNAVAFRLSSPAPCANTGVCATADLDISHAQLIGPVPIGNPLAFVLTVTNAGPAVAAGVTLTDTLPAGSSFLLAAPQSCLLQAPSVVCGLGDLSAGQSATAVMVLTPTLADTLVNTATVATQTPDSNPANDTTTQETPVGCAGAGPHALSGRVKADQEGLARVTVTLLGTSGCQATATTDRRGGYSFTGLAEGSYTVAPSRERSCTFKPRRRQVAIQGAGARAAFKATCR